MRDNERQWETMRDNERQWETMRDNERQWETLRNIGILRDIGAFDTMIDGLTTYRKYSSEPEPEVATCVTLDGVRYMKI